MPFSLPKYHEPDFSSPTLSQAPDAKLALIEKDGVAPSNFHSTSMYPEYFKLKGQWYLAEESRMDCCVVVEPQAEGFQIHVVEGRNLKKGQLAVVGRSEDGREGIFLWAQGFDEPANSQEEEAFAFRGSRSRETAHSKDYDQLYEILEYEKENGFILWVMGPAFAFDADARRAMQSLTDRGYVHGLMAGNALATHDLEAGYLGTALGQDIYTQESKLGGHYHHLEVINLVRRAGSIPAFIQEHQIQNGIMYSLVQNDIPFVLTSSIRDDGPLPEVIADAYVGQGKMREMVRKATTVICLATQLHTIATGNMTPSYRVINGVVRPVFLYAVDISEFILNKLADRGSLTAHTFCTNVQDFIVHVNRGVK